MNTKEIILNYIDSIDDPELLDFLERLFELGLKNEAEFNSAINILTKENTVQSPSKA